MSCLANSHWRLVCVRVDIIMRAGALFIAIRVCVCMHVISTHRGTKTNAAEKKSSTEIALGQFARKNIHSFGVTVCGAGRSLSRSLLVFAFIISNVQHFCLNCLLARALCAVRITIIKTPWHATHCTAPHRTTNGKISFICCHR